MKFPFHVVPSAPPQSVLLTVTSPSEISMFWSEVPPVHRNGVITLYEVSYSSLSNSEDSHNPVTTLLNTTHLSVNLTGLEEFVNYSFQVRAYTEVGPGPYSEQQYVRIGVHCCIQRWRNM